MDDYANVRAIKLGSITLMFEIALRGSLTYTPVAGSMIERDKDISSKWVLTTDSHGNPTGFLSWKCRKPTHEELLIYHKTKSI